MRDLPLPKTSGRATLARNSPESGECRIDLRRTDCRSDHDDRRSQDNLDPVRPVWPYLACQLRIRLQVVKSCSCLRRSCARVRQTWHLPPDARASTFCASVSFEGRHRLSLRLGAVSALCRLGADQVARSRAPTSMAGAAGPGYCCGRRHYSCWCSRSPRPRLPIW